MAEIGGEQGGGGWQQEQPHLHRQELQDSVVQHVGQAVAEGAKRFQTGGRSFRSVKKSIQRWEEAAVSCKGPKRLEILRRWVLLLKEVERQKLSLGSVETNENVLKQAVAADDMNEI